MNTYRYTIFDANPQTSSGTDWPSHSRVELSAASDKDAEDAVCDVMQAEAERGVCRPDDGYKVGQKLYAIIWGDDGQIVGEPTYTLTAEDLDA